MIRIWATEIKAICPLDGQLKIFGGPNIHAPTHQLAHDFCQNNGLGYCLVTDEVIGELPCKKDSFNPDWDNAVDYRKIQDN